MGSPNDNSDSQRPPSGQALIPSQTALKDNSIHPTQSEPSRTVSSRQDHQQNTPRKSVDHQELQMLPAAHEVAPDASEQRPASPFARSADSFPAPPTRAVSPQIATKFIKTSELKQGAPSGSPLRKGYVVIHKDNQENTPPVPEQEQQKTLYRPKSKLRLRLKLTPPHPAGVKIESTPTKPSLKVRLLSSSNRVNEQPVRKPSHKQQTSISTIRADSPAVKVSPENTSTPEKNFVNYFPTYFKSGSPQDVVRGVADDQEREERERRTAGWYPPTKAIPRSRSAWNLRVDAGKAGNAISSSEGRFESDFDGRVSEEVGEGKFEPSTDCGATVAKDALESISAAASSTLIPDVDSNPYLKAGFAVSESSFASQTPYDPTQNQSLRSGTPQPHDALAVIAAEHPNNSSSTVNLTLTDSEHSSSRSTTPDGQEALKSNVEDLAQKHMSPLSATSSSPFTLDKSIRKRMERSGEWTDTSISSAPRSPNESFAWSGILTPQKGIGQRQQTTSEAGTRTVDDNQSASSKCELLSPYSNGLKPIAMDAVNAWSPSKAFAYTDRQASATEPVLDRETEPDTVEDGEEVLNDSYKTDMTGNTSALLDQVDNQSQSEGASLHEHHSLAMQQAETSRYYATETQAQEYHAQATPSKGADTSVDSGYTAPIYSTPPKLERRRNPDVRRREKEAKGEVSNDIFSLSDQMLSDRYKFVQEIGFGNWGSVWQCKPRTPAAHPLHRSSVSRNRPSLSHAVASQHHPTKVAIKLVHRSKQATTAARVRALWSEMKIVRTLKAEPHPNIIGFDSFIITPSYALIIMPFLAQLMPVSISEERAKGYFMQLTSALAYLHDNGVTHNDIKPSNIMLSCTNTPIFVDFGFAQKWDVNAIDTGANTLIGGLTTLTGHNTSCHELFQSEISWGTPEYLDPQRAKGLRHDERASDVWALGVTFFEILIGRTPFEESEDEQFSTTEQLNVYHERTVEGKWLGDWSMSSPMKALLRSMIQPDPTERITAQEAHQHRALAVDVNTDMSTPPFVRTAASLPVEPKEKKQVPRERRDQKRSQALQAETGAKFIKNENKTKVFNEVERIKADLNMMAAPIQETSNKSVKPESYAREEFEVARNGMSNPVDKQSTKDLRGVEGNVENGSAANRASPRGISLRAGPEALTEVESWPPSDLQKIGTKEPMASTVPAAIRHASPPQISERVLRRPASAAALRNIDPSPHDAVQYMVGGNAFDRTRYVQIPNRTGGAAGYSDYLRHTRVASEGAMRLLDNANHPESMKSDKLRPKSQLIFARLNGGEDIRNPANQPRHLDAVRQWNTHMAIPKASRIQDELDELRNATSTADLDAKLDRLALWVEDIEHIVEEAKYALKAVQAERPPSRQLFREMELEQHIQDGQRPSINIVRPPSAAESRVHNLRRPSSSLHLRYESNFELAPVVQTGDFRPTHLRRQRSDLTNFRSRANPDIEELRRRDYELRGYDEWPESRLQDDFAKKLKTYRSAGDLHRLADLRKKEHEKILEEIERNNCDTERWFRLEGRKAYLVAEPKKFHQESRLKSMLHSVKSIFKRRD
ncbi:hypothetical protein NCC49_000525 [Naganishia albida]|nr:hypothetical protein NCC49_000525 [Naganishia albida]